MRLQLEEKSVVSYLIECLIGIKLHSSREFFMLERLEYVFHNTVDLPRAEVGQQNPNWVHYPYQNEKLMVPSSQAHSRMVSIFSCTS